MPGRCRAFMAAVFLLRLNKRTEILSAPAAHPVLPRLSHDRQIALPAAVFPAVPSVAGELFSTERAFTRSRLLGRVCLVVFLPPLLLALFAAKRRILQLQSTSNSIPQFGHTGFPRPCSRCLDWRCFL